MFVYLHIALCVLFFSRALSNWELKFLATVFVLVNLIGQLGGCGLVITRFKVDIACGLLFSIVVLQVSGWNGGNKWPHSIHCVMHKLAQMKKMVEKCESKIILDSFA